MKILVLLHNLAVRGGFVGEKFLVGQGERGRRPSRRFVYSLQVLTLVISYHTHNIFMEVLIVFIMYIILFYILSTSVPKHEYQLVGYITQHLNNSKYLRNGTNYCSFITESTENSVD